MNFEFQSKDLQALYVTGSGKIVSAFPRQVIEEFFLAMAEITAAVDERDLRALKSRKFEKLLTGSGDYSMRLNKQYRLLLKREATPQGTKLMIQGIEDYH